MGYKIIYSNLATKTIDDNLNYLINNWSIKSSAKFLDKVDKTIVLLLENPEFYPFWNTSNNIRKAIIVKQITLFYKVKENTIEILLFWNNYQNPEKLLKLIK
jgi:plasmid stabilization system protein ParE